MKGLFNRQIFPITFKAIKIISRHEILADQLEVLLLIEEQTSYYA